MDETRKLYNRFLDHELSVGGRVGPSPYAEDNFERKEALLALVDSLRLASILDLGCGVGEPALRPLHQLGYDITGLDISDRHLDLCGGLKVVLGDANHIEFPDSSFDLVICGDLLEHVPQPEVVIAEANRVTRKWAIFSVPNETGPVDGQIHLRLFDEASFKALLLAQMDLVSLKYLERQHRPAPGWDGWWMALCEKRGARG